MAVNFLGQGGDGQLLPVPPGGEGLGRGAQASQMKMATDAEIVGLTAGENGNIGITAGGDISQDVNITASGTGTISIISTAGAITMADGVSAVSAAGAITYDAKLGVAAAKNGNMLCVGIAREGDREILENERADIIVSDLAEVDYARLEAMF